MTGASERRRYRIEFGHGFLKLHTDFIVELRHHHQSQRCGAVGTRERLSDELTIDSRACMYHRRGRAQTRRSSYVHTASPVGACDHVACGMCYLRRARPARGAWRVEWRRLWLDGRGRTRQISAVQHSAELEGIEISTSTCGEVGGRGGADGSRLHMGQLRSLLRCFSHSHTSMHRWW